MSLVRLEPYTWLKASLAAACVAYLVYVVEWASLVAAIGAANLLWIVVAAALLPLNMLLEAWTWHRLARLAAPTLTFKEAVGALLSGYTLGFFTPGRVGEYAGRAFFIAHSDRWTLAVLVFTQHLYDLLVSTAVGLPALLYYVAAYQPRPVLAWHAALGYGSLVVALLGFLLLVPRPAYRLLTRVLPFARVRRHAAFLSLLATRRSAGILTLAFLRYLVYTMQFVLLLGAFNLVPPLGPGFVGVALVFFASFLLPPITLLDLGIREGAAVFFFGSLGLLPAAALSAALVLFGLNFVLPSVAGLPFVLRLRLGRQAEPVDEKARVEHA